MDMNQKEYWNSQAKHFSQIMESGSEAEYFRRLIAFMEEKGGAGEGRRVLDVGCGAGKYARAFLEGGSEVVLTDFSDQMLKYASEACAEYAGKFETVQLDWNADDYFSHPWENGFDLVFASMVPAIADEESVRRLCLACRGICFVAKFFKRTDHMNEAFAKAAQIETPKLGNKVEYTDIVAHAEKLGYHPEVQFVDYGWENRWPPEQAAARYEQSLRMSGAKEMPNHARLVEIAQGMAEADGMVPDRSDVTAAWITWSVRGK